MFFHITGYTLVMGAIFYLIIYGKMAALVQLGSICVAAEITVIISFLIIFPASVNAKLRGTYKRMCVIAARCAPILSLKQRINLCYAMKRFSTPIAFTLWNSKYLEYNDYLHFVAGLAMHFCLAAKLAKNYCITSPL